MNVADRMTRRLSHRAMFVGVLFAVSAMNAFAQSGNRAVMFGKQIASSGTSFVISQANPDPRALFVFSSVRNSARFVSRVDAPTRELSTRFADTLAMNSSGLVVGNPRANSGKGGVLVYPVSRSGRINVNGVKPLQPDLSFPYGQFGSAVSVTENLVAASAPNATPAGQSSGVVFLFEKQGSDYKLVQTLTAGGPSGEIAQFGGSLAIDDRWLVVGVPGAASDRRGEVRVFPRTGKSFAEQPALVLEDSDQPGSSYGWLVKMSPLWLIVSALEQTESCEGAVYAYRRNRDGSIDEASKIHVRVPADAADPKDSFGGAIAVTDSLLFVSLMTPSTSGKVLIFDLEKATAGIADTVVQTLEPPARSGPDQFGESMAVLGTNVLIGSPPPISSQSLLGATYLFSPDRKGVYSAAARIDPRNGVKMLK